MPIRRPPITQPTSGGMTIGPPPLFPPSFGLLTFHADWRSTWTHIVSGKFSKSGYSGLLFYEQSTGYSEFYETDGLGGITFLRNDSTWRTSWTHIVSGPFYGPDRTGLLFYDQAAGFAAIYDIDGGNLVEVREYSERDSWTHITTVRITILGPDGTAVSDCPGVVFYDQAAGHVEIRKCNGSGELELVMQIDGWRKSWTHVVGDAVAGSGLLFYEGSTSHGEIYTVVCDHNNNGSFGAQIVQDGLPPATDIIAGNFGWIDTGFLFYDRASGRGTFVYSDATFGGISVSNEAYTDWRLSWDIIVSGVFWAADPEDLKFQNGFTSLLFYDRANSYGEFYFHAPFDAALARPLDGYVSPASVIPGETISFYVNSQVGPYTINIFRQDMEEVLVARIQNIEQFPQLPIGRLDFRDGPAWPPVADFVIPQDWPSGLYLARVETPGLGPLVGPAETATIFRLAAGAPSNTLIIPFVVRAAVPGSQSKILLYIDDTTYEAYNYWGGRSLYGFAAQGSLFFSSPGTGDSRLPRAFRVSFNRPYRHIYEISNHITKWQKWEVPMIRWLARRGIAVEVCTATDIHKDQANQEGLLQNYQLLFSAGHYEYWSTEMRDNVENFAAAGGNVAFFSGNVCWWQVRIDLDTQSEICYKEASFDPYTETQPGLSTVHWQCLPVCRPETSLTGVSWNGSVDASPVYVVRQPDHWVFQGLDFVKGSYFGFYRDQNGIRTTVLDGTTETDVFQPSHGPSPCPPSSPSKCLPSSPSNFVKLAESPGLGYTGDKPDDPIAATMGIFTNGKGQVFTVGTINWALGLSQDGGWNEMDQITLNVFQRLG